MVGFPGGGCLKEHSDKLSSWCFVYCIVSIFGVYNLLASRVVRFVVRFGFR